MKRIFEARFYNEAGRYCCFESEEPGACITEVEAVGSGSVTLFIERPNLPGRLPETVQNSLAQWRYEKGKWESISIFTGAATAMGEEKPHLV